MNIDTSKIAGYETMTVEDKIKALEAFEIAEPDYSGYVKKDLYDRKVSELSAKKKELEAKMSTDELAQQQRDDQMTAMQAELEALRAERTVNSYVTKLVGLGYDEKSAMTTAKALAEGKMDDVFTSLTTFKESLEKGIKAKALKDTPRPEGGNGGGAVDYQKKIEEAQARGNFAEAAYYTRLMSENTGTQK